MTTLVNNFNETFPKYKITNFTDYTSIVEHSNKNNNKFRELQLRGFDGFAFYDHFAQEMKSFADKSGHRGCLLNDCDGIHLFEFKGEKYLMLSELKSTFITQKTELAKKQIIGTYLKLRSLLNVLQGFNSQDYHIFGLIAAYKPTDEIISAISKKENQESAFAIQLNANCKCFMSACRCNEDFCSLNVRNFLIAYVPIPKDANSYTVDIEEIINLIL